MAKQKQEVLVEEPIQVKKVEVKNVQQIRNNPDYAPAQYETAGFQGFRGHDWK